MSLSGGDVGADDPAGLDKRSRRPLVPSPSLPRSDSNFAAATTTTAAATTTTTTTATTAATGTATITARAPERAVSVLGATAREWCRSSFNRLSRRGQGSKSTRPSTGSLSVSSATRSAPSDVPDSDLASGNDDGSNATGRCIPLRPFHENPLIDVQRRSAYISNAIRTSRYTLWDFLPKQIFFQFSRLGNFYFLCVGVPQMVPGLSTTGNYTTILPLMFFVLLTIFKEGYDDWKRHSLDKVENSRDATVLRRTKSDVQTQHGSLFGRWRRWLGRRRGRPPPRAGPAGQNASAHDGDQEPGSLVGLSWSTVKWRNIRVGDIIKLVRDEEVPADIVLLHADGENGLGYVETMALDGETNLKSKQVSAVLNDCGTVEGIATCRVEFEVELPNLRLYSFDGKVTRVDKDETKTLPLTLNEVVYRGCVVRNTPHLIGMVINTGEECKIRRNANRHPSAKRPAIERIINRIVISLAIYVLVLSVGCSMGYLIWTGKYEHKAWYLQGLGVPFQEIIIGYAIQFNNIVPLSLYVCLEIVKIGQMLMLNWDIDMYDKASDTPARSNTNTILENLGQISYVFSDKTGTLTQNLMNYRKMSIAGTSWLHKMDLGTAENGRTEKPTTPLPLPPGEKKTGGLLSVGLSRLRINTSHSSANQSIVAETPMSPRRSVAGRRSSSYWRSTGRPDMLQPDMTTDDLLQYIRLVPNSNFSKRAKQYILAMALCHTCLPEVKDGKVEFQAASPDEVALVKAAQQLGFLVIQRSSQSITLRISAGPGSDEVEEQYQILDVLEFSSKRKRMSVVVRCPDGRVWLITKGADSVVLPRLRHAHLAMKKANELHESVEVERERQRRSEAREPRNSFGGRPSLQMRRSTGGWLSPPPPSLSASRSSDGSSVGGSDPNVSQLRPSLKRSETSGMTLDGGRRRSLALVTYRRGVSFEISTQPEQHSKLLSVTPLRSPLEPPPGQPTVPVPAVLAVPTKFDFLNDPAVDDDAEIFARCFRHIDEFATEGLRTLLFAHKYLSDAEYASWKKLYLDAETSLVERQERVEAVGDMIEQSLDLIGASAIEDKLQKGVPETIDRLSRANIRVFMLTGDKRETAINIAHSARICRKSSEMYILDSTKGNLKAQIIAIIEELQVQIETNASHLPNHTVVVIDGHTLASMEDSPDDSSPDGAGNDRTTTRRLFYTLIPNVHSVICCRASPAQKASLVRAIRKSRHGISALFQPPSSAGAEQKPRRLLCGLIPLPFFSWPSPSSGQHPAGGPLTLAIGDGANDLAMLSEAHVGVGISGREGLQAARVADYSIAQFRFLGRMLLVHGRWNYMRTARFVVATFWKEFFFYLPTALYQRLNGYTGTSLYEGWSLTVLNVLFTSLCVCVPGIVEQDLAADTLLAVPELYVFGQRDKGLNLAKFLRYMILATVEGVLSWFLCWALYGAVSPVRDGGLFALGNLVFTVNVLWTNLKLLILDTHHKNWIVLFSFWLAIALWWIWQGILDSIYSPHIAPYVVRGAFATGFGRDGAWWIALVGVLGLLATFELAFRSVKRGLVASGMWKWGWKWLSWATWRRAFCLHRREPAGFAAAAMEDNTGFDIAAILGGDGSGRPTGVEEWDVELWQALEKDPDVRETLRQMNRMDDEEKD